MSSAPPHHDVQILLAGGSDQSNAAPRSEAHVQKHVGMELGQECVQQDLLSDRLGRTESVHVDPSFVRDGINDVVGLAQRVLVHGRQEGTEVAGAVHVQGVLGRLPPRQTRQQLLGRSKVELGEGKQ